MFESYNKLSDDQLVEKVRDINNKLNCAYASSVSQSFIDTLLNALLYIENIQEERLFMKDMNLDSGVVYDSSDIDNTVETSKTDNKEVETTRKYTAHKFNKVYRTDED